MSKPPLALPALALALLLSPPSPLRADERNHAQDCVEPTATDQIALCLSHEYEQADSELNTAYQQVQSLLAAAKGDGSCGHCGNALTELRQAQRAWVQYRDHDCNAVHAFLADGTARGPGQMQCLRDHTRERVAQLRRQFELDL